MSDVYLSQTFKLKSSGGNDGYFITSIDLYFSEKDPDLGVAVEIREVSDGVPTIKTLPDARVWRSSAQVTASSISASTPTTFTFATPVFVKSDIEYALMLIPDGLSPNYKVWTAKTGLGDVDNTSLINNRNWGDGTLFFSTSGSAWTPIQDEDLKFKVKVASFYNSGTSASGTAVFENGDYEFLTLSNVFGTFKGGENVAQIPTQYANGTLTFSNTSTSVTGNGTLLTSGFGANTKIGVIFADATSSVDALVTITAGSTTMTRVSGAAALNTTLPVGTYVRISNNVNGEIRQIRSVTSATSVEIDAPLSAAATSTFLFIVDTPVFDVITIQSVANNTSIVSDKYGKRSGRASFFKAVTGSSYIFNASKAKLTLSNSNASNSSFLFKTSNATYLATVFGDVSQAQAQITSINNTDVSYILPMINKFQPTGTELSLRAGVFDSNVPSVISQRDYPFGVRSRILYDGKVKSKSNEINGTTLTKSLKVSVPLLSKYKYLSPVVDIYPASVAVQSNIINDDATNERTRYGNSYCRYISKILTLAEGQDAEDFIVYITAYKPPETNIYVAARFLSASDRDNITSKQWTILAQETPEIYSSSLDESDRREYKYVLKTIPWLYNLNGIASSNTQTTTLTGYGTSWNTGDGVTDKIIAANDHIFIARSDNINDYVVRRAVTVTSGTQITIDRALPSTWSPPTVVPDLIVSKLARKQQAFKYSENGSIIRYYSPDWSAYDKFKYVQLKIILTSPNHYNVPLVDDVRAICTTA